MCSTVPQKVIFPYKLQRNVLLYSYCTYPFGLTQRVVLADTQVSDGGFTYHNYVLQRVVLVHTNVCLLK